MSTTQEKIMKPKLGLLELAKQLGNVSQACKVMGYSRDTFYRFKELYETGGDTVSPVNKKITKIESKLPKLYCEIKKYCQFPSCVAVYRL